MDALLKKLSIIVVIVVIIFIIASRAFFVVNEGEQAVVIRFGRVLPHDYTTAGLKFKVPFIDGVQKYPKKLLPWDGQSESVPTTDQKLVSIDTTARWRIVDPKIFYSKLTGVTDAQSKLDNIIDKRVRNVIVSYPMVEIVRTNNEMIALGEKREQAYLDSTTLQGVDEDDPLAEILAPIEPKETLPSTNSSASTIVEVSKGRLALEQEILKVSREKINRTTFGIEIVDVMVRQVQYPENVAAKTYERMASERKKHASEQRSRGEGQKAYWLGRLEKEKQTIVAKAESRAAEIYRQSYNKDPEFYRFWRAMDSYEVTLSDMDKIFSTDMAYFDYLYSPRGER